MEIVRTNNVISITSPYASGYKYIHVTQIVENNQIVIFDSTFTETVSTVTTTADGYFIITEVKLPESESPGNYYILGGKIYNPLGEEITLEELLATDTDETNIVKESQEFLSYYFLNKYYIDLIESKLLKNVFSCNCMTPQDRVLIDTLSMGLDVIKTLMEYNQFYEAKRILDKMSVCSGLVNPICKCNG